MNINIYSYLETSGGQSSNLHLNVVHFFNTSVNYTSVAADDNCFPALVSNMLCPISIILSFLLRHLSMIPNDMHSHNKFGCRSYQSFQAFLDSIHLIVCCSNPDNRGEKEKKMHFLHFFTFPFFRDNTWKLCTWP